MLGFGHGKTRSQLYDGAAVPAEIRNSLLQAYYMNLWLRLIALMLFRDRRRVDLLATTRMRLRAWPTDLDFNGHVNNGRYLMLADLARIDWFLRTGIMQIALRRGAFPVVGDVMAKFRRDLRLFQSFEIHSRLLGWDERWGFLEHRFVRDGRVIGVVAIRGMFRGRDGQLSPGQLLSALQKSTASPPLPEWLSTWHRSSEELSAMLRLEEGRHAGKHDDASL
jgi:acyl-CoA thioesterase FadM